MGRQSYSAQTTPATSAQFILEDVKNAEDNLRSKDGKDEFNIDDLERVKMTMMEEAPLPATQLRRHATTDGVLHHRNNGGTRYGGGGTRGGNGSGPSGHGRRGSGPLKAHQSARATFGRIHGDGRFHWNLRSFAQGNAIEQQRKRASLVSAAESSRSNRSSTREISSSQRKIDRNLSNYLESSDDQQQHDTENRRDLIEDNSIDYGDSEDSTSAHDEETDDFFEYDEKFQDLKFGEISDLTMKPRSNHSARGSAASVRRMNGSGTSGSGASTLYDSDGLMVVPPPPPPTSTGGLSHGRNETANVFGRTSRLSDLGGGGFRSSDSSAIRMSTSDNISTDGGTSVFGHESSVSLFRNSKPKARKRHSRTRYSTVATDIFYGSQNQSLNGTNHSNNTNSLLDSTDEEEEYSQEEDDDYDPKLKPLTIPTSSNSTSNSGGFDVSERTAGQHARVKCRVGFVDGREIKFYLLENISQKPKTSREERQHHLHKNIHCQRSSYESRARNWLMKRGLVFLSALYLAVFVVVNLFFAVLFFADSGKCCDDPDMTFGELFSFAVQTSTTIGYGGFIPEGHYANSLVVFLSYTSTLINTVFAGLFFAWFVRPDAKLVFSDVMTYCNFNGLPCLSLRVGNVDGFKNKLTNIEARLTCIYVLNYEDENGSKQEFGQTEELKLLNDKLQIMRDVWTLRHVLDETSPLFGLHLNEYPGSSIVEFRISISAIQETTQGAISEQTGYMKEDVLIGHDFDKQSRFDQDTSTVINDYSLMSTTHPQPVWYPAASGDHIMP